MTRADHDRRQSKLSLASLTISILALITSTAAPFVAYYWLQASLRIYELKRSSFSAEGEIKTSDCEGFPKGASYELRIENSGSLPIEKVRVLIERRSRPPKARIKAVDPDPKNIRAFPPVLIDVQKHDRGIIITFKDAISPHSLILLNLTEFTVLDKNMDLKSAGPFVWVFSEVSDEHLSWSEAYIYDVDCP